MERPDAAVGASGFGFSISLLLSRAFYLADSCQRVQACPHVSIVMPFPLEKTAERQDLGPFDDLLSCPHRASMFAEVDPPYGPRTTPRSRVACAVDHEGIAGPLASVVRSSPSGEDPPRVVGPRAGVSDAGTRGRWVDHSTRTTLREIAKAVKSHSVDGALATPRLTPGTHVIREWGNERHQVTVETAEFVYRGQRYRSLSEIARRITGTRWSGPLFFGVTPSAKGRGRASNRRLSV